MPEQNNYTLLDLNRSISELGNDRNTETLHKQEGVSIVLLRLQAGARMAEHAAPGTATIHVFDGRVRFQIGTQSIAATAGQILVLDAGTRHAVEADEASTLLITLVSPPASTD